MSETGDGPYHLFGDVYVDGDDDVATVAAIVGGVSMAIPGAPLLDAVGLTLLCFGIARSIVLESD